MKNLALIACRKLLFLEVVEAARYIGDVEPRTWRYYESGRSNIPEHIAKKMMGLMQRRLNVLSEMRAEAIAFRKKGEGRQAVPYYVKFEDYQNETGLDDYLEFCIDCTVKSVLFTEDHVVFY
ncbi:Aca2/YdiL-like domain-containing protein [Leclercia sp.]|uniref:Aca2/YdiL-like domain-containing protein n=1 Tax=Leclercia sp. TaxID=1898428 RepID=UPI002FDDB31C